MDRKSVIKELALRQLQKRHKQESDNYIDFVKYWFKEGKKFDFDVDNFHYLIATYLEKCYRGEITRLIINIPPRHGKTEMITKCFPAWWLGKDPTTKIIVTGYSSTLTQQFSLEAKDIVKSQAYSNIFPRNKGIRGEQDTKEYWVLNEGGSYYATGTGGSITGKGANCVTGDTMIMTKKGEKRIDSIDLTDKIDILSYNHTTNTQEYKPMIAYMRTKNQKVYDIQTTGGNRIRATAGHKFFILGRGYTEAKDIKEGDKIIKNKAMYTPQRQKSKKQGEGESCDSLFSLSHNPSCLKIDTISSIAPIAGNETVYDIEVQDNHNFFANGILTHNCFIIDDPIKPDEAESDIIRTGINNWFENTVPSRLDNPNKGCIIIIMQRTHEDDLCGHLIEKMKNHTGDDWTVLSMPAIAEKDEYIAVDDFVFTRLQGEVLHPKRFNADGIEKIRKNMNNSTFECQYQQNPISKESQEFHTEWFKYVDTQDVPLGGRIFTTVDPAWTKQTYSDYTSIITGKFIDDKLYILKYTAGKFDPAESIDEIIKHIKLYNPEKIGVEAIQAKNVLSAPLNNTCKTMGIYANIEEIAQKGDKESRIRKLIPLFRDGLVYFTRGLEDGQEVSLEKQLLHFPRGKHDDVIDSLQMLYDMYTLQPNVQSRHRPLKVTYHNGRPVLSK